jgi:hypothetical protein
MSRFPFVLAAIVAVSSYCFAQTAPSQLEHFKATVTGVEGLVQVRASEEAPWQKATVGMVVGENAEFRTGPKSAVRFTIPPDQTITLDRLGTVKVLQAVLENGKVKTKLGMRYGRTRYDIEAAGREHESTITTPSSTLAVRGTKVSVYDQRPFPAEAVSLTGRAEFRDFKKRISFGGKNAGKTTVNTQSGNAASLALDSSVVDPGISLARTDAEQALVASLLSRGANVSFDFEKGIRVVRGGTVPRTDAELLPLLPGTLNFVLRWTGNTDLNLVLISPGTGPGNRTLYPLGGFDLLPKTGATMAFDHRGGPNGGIEICFWPGTFPDGSYRIGAQYISGEITPATVDVFRDGQRVPIRTSQGDVTTASFTGQPIDPNIATGIGVGTVRIFQGQERAGAAVPLAATASKSVKSGRVVASPMPVAPIVAKRQK